MLDLDISKKMLIQYWAGAFLQSMSKHVILVLASNTKFMRF